MTATFDPSSLSDVPPGSTQSIAVTVADVRDGQPVSMPITLSASPGQVTPAQADTGSSPVKASLTFPGTFNAALELNHAPREPGDDADDRFDLNGPANPHARNDNIPMARSGPAAVAAGDRSRPRAPPRLACRGASIRRDCAGPPLLDKGAHRPKGPSVHEQQASRPASHVEGLSDAVTRWRQLLLLDQGDSSKRLAS